MLQHSIFPKREANRKLRVSFKDLLFANIVEIVNGEWSRATRVFANFPFPLLPGDGRAVSVGAFIREPQPARISNEQRASKDASLIYDEYREVHLVLGDFLR